MTTGRFGDLPYDPRIGRLLGKLDAGFKLANRWFALPMLRAGLGPLLSTPLTGAMLILRTTGRTSGRTREVPLGYLIAEGAVYVCAGFGSRTALYRNLLADPRVEVVLPSAAFAGTAEPVTDEAEWNRIMPRYVDALALIGRGFLGDVRHASPERLDELRAGLPLVRIRPTGIAPGPADPGGRLGLLVHVLAFAWLGRRAWRALRR